MCWLTVSVPNARVYTHTCIRGGILSRLRGFPWNKNWNPWLMTIISTGEKIDRGGNPKQSESIFGLSAFCLVLKLFPDVRAHCIVVLAFKNGHANRHRFRRKFRWNRNEEWLEVAMGRKKDRRWKHPSLFEKDEIMCYDPVVFCLFLKWN